MAINSEHFYKAGEETECSANVYAVAAPELIFHSIAGFMPGPGKPLRTQIHGIVDSSSVGRIVLPPYRDAQIAWLMSSREGILGSRVPNLITARTIDRGSYAPALQTEGVLNLLNEYHPELASGQYPWVLLTAGWNKFDRLCMQVFTGNPTLEVHSSITPILALDAFPVGYEMKPIRADESPAFQYRPHFSELYDERMLILNGKIEEPLHLAQMVQAELVRDLFGKQKSITNALAKILNGTDDIRSPETSEVEIHRPTAAFLIDWQLGKFPPLPKLVEKLIQPNPFFPRRANLPVPPRTDMVIRG